MDSSPVARLAAAIAGRYTLERELGRGGMATVWLTRDLKHDRLVALKVLRPELAAALGPERFLREIAVTAGLDHPHILPLLDSGDAPGFLYYTMPYVEGESLRERLSREKQLPLDDALQITREVADALGYAHSRGIVHRDIKPENILLAGGHARVADFGIATALTVAGGDRLTETGIAVGTPAYMSPEQGAGSRDLDGRSDLYSLGCVLYEMLGGETPYLGHTPQAILAKKLSEPAPRVSVLRETVPEPVEAALRRALARTPADRFSTAAQFTAALAVDVETHQRRKRTWRQARPLIGVGVVVTALAALLLQSGSRPGSPRPTADPREPVVVVPFAVRATDPGLADLSRRVATELTDAIAQDGLGAVVPPPTVATSESAELQEELRRIAMVSRAATVVTGTVYQRGDSLEIQARLLRADGLRPIFALPVERGAVAAPALPLQAAKDRVLGAVAHYLSPDARGQDVSLYRPPSSLGIFRLWQRAGEAYRRDDLGQAASLYHAAYRADTSNLGYLVQSAVAYNRQNDQMYGGVVDSILLLVAQRRTRLTRGEALWFDYARARWRSPEEEYHAALAGYAADSVSWRFEAMLAALHDNRPAAALQYFRERDSASVLASDRGRWVYAAVEALHKLGQFEDALALIRNEREPGMSPDVGMEAGLVAALGRTRELDSLITASHAVAYPMTAGQLMFSAASELEAHGHIDAGRRLMQRAADWLAQQRFDGSAEFHRLNVLEWAYYDLGRYGDAQRTAEAVARIQATARTGIEGLVFRGLVAARLGDTVTALGVARQYLAERRPWLRQAGLNQAGYIYALLGQPERAVVLLREAMNGGARTDYTHEGSLESLRDYPPFQALVRLKW